MVVLAVFATALVSVFSWQISHFIANVFFHVDQVTTGTRAARTKTGMPSTWPLLWILAIGAMRALLIWGQEWLAITAANRAKSELRQKFIFAVLKLGPAWANAKTTSQLTLTATTRLDALDPYFSKFLPQLIYTTIITPILTLIIWLADPLSGVEVLITIPLVPVFMIFIGWATEAVQQKQLDATGRLSQHFGEVLRGVTTLRIFGRAEKQLETIEASSEQYRIRTLKVLRISFLSGFALELIASLSVALVAVTIGLRLVNGDISFQTGLFVLLLAPEAFLPLRMVGAQFHASSEGVAASKEVLDIIDAAAADKPVPESAGNGLRISGISIQDFETGHVTQIKGPSGAGKTTMLGSLRSQLPSEQVSWLPQRISLFPGTVAQNIVGPSVQAQTDKLALAAKLAALDDVTLEQQVGQTSSALSGGQAQRVALARAFYRALSQNTPYLLLDEPISALDQERVEVVNESLRHFSANGTTVIAVSHQHVSAATFTMEVGLD
ncbi:MAG: hypothetical protein RL508_50 [Actinomycetota bacterium]